MTQSESNVLPRKGEIWKPRKRSRTGAVMFEVTGVVPDGIHEYVIGNLWFARGRQTQRFTRCSLSSFVRRYERSAQ